ncbi:xylose isomerase-like enzyme [Sphaerochaeta pleomorpha str. Grapes]|uniref:Xylose isomerase-like enzyme n=1 Tax=Sphaerochaeta pleomorpha (strain ATCC BAA-1885 / DSM 22778 / Grapes) TaxID=158190 RepID=G8QQF4_SPHPG|nr:TIM barrel protein [Sphaerochaeta pleomorpha]AEV29799.1 xylose isomerase-like enzyme [Sphaerochaeta pleomorpha str. Grapes]
MDCDIKRYLKVGIIHHMAYPEAFSSEKTFEDTFLRVLEDPYFDVVETASTPWPSMKEKIRSWVDQAHMEVAFGAQGKTLSKNLNLNDLDPAERKKAVAAVKEGIDEAAEIGAFGLSFLSGHYEDKTIFQSMEVLIESCQILCEYAKQYSLPICLEAFDYSIDKKALIGPSLRAKALFDTVCLQYPSFGLLVDCSHIPMIGENLDDNLDPVVRYVRHAHMGNTYIKDPSNPAYGDNHPRFGFPQSENDADYLASYLKKLIAIGYLQKDKPMTVSFEVKPQKGELSSLVIANAKRTLADAWRKV